MLKFAMASFVSFLMLIVVFVLGIYAFVLFVKLANRGIKALDIYIEKNSKKEEI